MRMDKKMKYIKYLGNKQRGNTKLLLVYILEGYDIYIPQYYYNQVSFLEKGCPIWIELSKDIYDVFEIADSNKWKEEAILFIQKNLPRIEDPICKDISLSDAVITEVERRKFSKNLSGRLFDRAGNVVSEIIALRETVPSNIIEDNNEEIDVLPTIKIIVKSCSCRATLKDLMEWVLSRKCLTDYQNEVLWYEASEKEDYSKELGFSQLGGMIYMRKVSAR